MCKIQIFWKPVLVRFEIIHIHCEAWLSNLGCSLMKRPMIIEKMQWGSCGSGWSKPPGPSVKRVLAPGTWSFTLAPGSLGQFSFRLRCVLRSSKGELTQSFSAFSFSSFPSTLCVFTPSSSVLPSLTFFSFSFKTLMHLMDRSVYGSLATHT